MGRASNSNPRYPNFPSRCYEYPKHALNELDAAPNRPVLVQGLKGSDGGDKPEYLVDGNQRRLLRPRALVVNRDGHWDVVEDGSYDGLYIFISFAAGQYPHPTDSTKVNEGHLDARARQLANKLGVKAYWCDYHCRAPNQPEATDDVHRFCDVVRGAHHVCVMLPDPSQNSLVFFGRRLWCLPEILLARNHQVMLCTQDPMNRHVDAPDSTVVVDIMEMAHRAWAVKETENQGIVRDIVNEETFRLLAEHYTGTITLSRLELIQVALNALRSRDWKEFQKGDIAYALMTLLTKRPRMDPTDTEEVALARLSLANDTDRIVERMICMDQRRRIGEDRTKKGWFSVDDDLHANLWDIEPLCQVAGVCKDGSIIIDGCHGISIRWKDIPRIYFVNRETWKKAWAGFGLRSGPLWFLVGVTLVALPGLKGAGAFLLVVGIILLILAPWSIATLYGGKVWGAKPWLIGFEGTLPIDEIERITFGNSIGRLMYTPSSGPYCSRRPDERIGTDPTPKFAKLPQGHRLFTLIDTVS
jgi:hypothetical protein